MFCVRSVCVEDGSVGWADKGLREVERGSLFSSWSEHVVPESLCHVLMCQERRVETIQLCEGGRLVRGCRERGEFGEGVWFEGGRLVN